MNNKGKLNDSPQMLNMQSRFRVNAPLTIAASFFITIIVTALILMLPISSKDGTFTDPVDALVTASATVSVTGLMTIPMPEWSLFGQAVIFIAMQVGGLGVITVYSAASLALGRKLHLNDSVLIQEQYNLNSYKGMGLLVEKILVWTLKLEAVGAIAYAVDFIPRYGLGKGIRYSCFYSVSAFCNAGITLDYDSLHEFAGNPYVCAVSVVLILSGAIGYIVMWDISKVCKEIKRGEYHRRHFWERLSLHTKINLTFSVILIVFFFLMVLILEWNNPESIGSFSAAKKILASFFEAVTVRTAGFETFAQSGMTDATKMISLLMMFIGGSPMGTAGGVKTMTVGIIIINVFCQIQGKKNTEAFGRQLPEENVATALAVLTVSVLMHIFLMVILLISQNGEFFETIYETVSAFSTAGMSIGLTPKLNVFGKLFICVAMYLGRIGPITIALAFSSQRKKYKKKGVLPKEEVIIG